MSLSFDEIVLGAKKLVIQISSHETIADNLISEVETVCSQIDSMKQYQEEVEMLNTEAKQRPHLQLITGIQRENKHIRDMQAQNHELRTALEDHQIALDLIMSKYRQQTASLMRLSKTDLSSLDNSKYTNVIIKNQAEKINEMAAVMKTAAALDEDRELKEKEMYHCLKAENATLREIINIANKYGSLNNNANMDSKTVQTEPEAEAD